MYKINKDEIAIVLRPTELSDKGDIAGEGDLHTAVAVHPDTILSDKAVNFLLDIATLMGAFLAVAQEDDYVNEVVSNARDKLLTENFEEDDEDSFMMSGDLYEEVEGTDGKVVRLTPFTKTEGSA